MQTSASSSGYLNYKGHIVTLPHNVQELADILPNCPEDVPMISFSLKDKTDNSTVHHVYGEKVMPDSQYKALPGNDPIEFKIFI